MATNLIKKVKILIVDDDIIIAETLSFYLRELGVKFIKMAHDEAAAMENINLWMPDIVLLDIRLDQKEEGLTIGKILSEQKMIPYMYITAHSDLKLVQKIIKTNPNGYLTKPINKASLIVAFHTLLDIVENKNKVVLNFLKKDDISIQTEDIIYFQASGNYWELVSYKGRQLLRSNYDEIMKELSEKKFQRIHRSYIVNLSAITDMSATKAKMINGQLLPVSRNFKLNN